MENRKSSEKLEKLTIRISKSKKEMLKKISINHEVMFINISDALMTGKNAFDIEKFKYLKIFLENLEKNFINGAEFLDANIIQEELIEISNKCKNE